MLNQSYFPKFKIKSFEKFFNNILMYNPHDFLFHPINYHFIHAFSSVNVFTEYLEESKYVRGTRSP